MQIRQSSMADGVFHTYYFEKNLQGDIIGVYNSSGALVYSYVYDAWGNFTATKHISSDTFASYNPFRYRGYYYDTDFGFYYLNSRYYDPITGRFLNADRYINANGDMIGYNMFAYCSNNPIKYVDNCGQSAEVVSSWAASMWWLTIADTVLPIGDIIYIAGIAILGIGTLILVDEVVTSQISFEEPKENEAGELPNQGDVSEIPDAPPVDAGKQGKHVPGHNNVDPNKSLWNEGENGVRQTQEAWKNGHDVPGRNGKIRIGQSSDGRTIRVHIDKYGKIHGYPIFP